MTNTISAAANPALANDLIQQAINEEPKAYEPKIVPPSDTTVNLPGGYINAAGEVFRTAEVRELNGKDEEVIGKATSIGKALSAVLERGTVSVGDEKATPQLLDSLLIGDRDSILLGILKTTFGNEVDVESYCTGCDSFKTASVNITEDIKSKDLEDPVGDRAFTLDIKAGTVVVKLPTGVVHKELLNNADKTIAELNTIILEKTIISINDVPVISKSQVQNLSITDRRAITEEINKRVPGPQFEDLTVACPDCGSEVTVPISLGTFFRF
jgi:hypothetical protein